jgi:hypothetical protein
MGQTHLAVIPVASKNWGSDLCMRPGQTEWV